MPDSEVPDGWRSSRLGLHLAAILGGGTPSRKVPEYWNGDIPWASVKDMKSRVLAGTEESITRAGLDSGATRTVPPGSIVLATRMAIGSVAVTTTEIAINQDLKALVPANGLDPRFLLHFLEQNATRLARWGTGTTVAGVRLDDVENLPLLLPAADEQRRIAEVLDSIDAVIEKTEAVIEATERLRSALLHELLTHGVPGWHTEWKDVPGIGTIPACWEVVRLGEVLADGPDNGLYKPESEYGSGVWIIRITDFSPGRLDRTSFGRVRATLEEVRTYAVGEGNILINRVNSLSHIGKSVLLPQLAEPAIFESNMMKIRVGEPVLPEYAIRVLCSPATRRYFLARAKKAVAQASINQTDVRQLVMPLPTREEQNALVAAVAKLDERTAVEAQTLTALTAAKSAVAAALMSGRVRVRMV